MQAFAGSITPALTSSSLNLPIAASNSVVGIAPASLFFVALTITMNRIAILRFDLSGPATVASAFINKTSGLLRRRHVGEKLFLR